MGRRLVLLRARDHGAADMGGIVNWTRYFGLFPFIVFPIILFPLLVLVGMVLIPVYAILSIFNLIERIQEC